MKRTLATAFLCLLLAAPAWAGFKEGVPAAKRGDFATALREWRPLAEMGHAKAQYNLGVMYRDGKGVTQDYVQAVQWFKKAVAHGFASAQYNLGVMYAKGRGVPQDYAEAARWYGKAAEQGHAKAQLKLSAMYAKGRGVPQDYIQVHKWANLAASQGQELIGTKIRETVTVLMTPAQIAEAQKQAREWRAKHRKN